MKYGYARVSSRQQHLTTQKNTLKEAGADKIYSEKVSGKSIDDRAQLNKLLNLVKHGDTIIVTKLDRLARSLQEGIQIIDELNSKGVTLNVLNMGVFNDTASSKLIRNMLLAVAEFERELILERQLEGIERAKERGVYQGRPKTYTDKHKGLQHALELFNDRDNNKLTVDEIAEITNISRATIYREARKMKYKYK